MVVLAGQRGHTVMVTFPYMTYTVSPLAGLGGGISWRPPAYSLSNMVFEQKSLEPETGVICDKFSYLIYRYGEMGTLDVGKESTCLRS